MTGTELLEPILGAVLVLAMALQSARYLLASEGGKPLPRAEGIRRGATYLLTAVSLAVPAAVILWWALAHPGGVAAIGLGFPKPWAMWLTLALLLLAVAVAAVAGAAFWHRRELRDAWHEDTIGSMEGILLDLMPRTPREYAAFLALTLVAGVAEEVIVRGFLHQWVSASLGWIPSLILTSLLFGGAHAYQGLGGVWKTAAFGAGLVLLREWTGTLWAPVAVHIGVNACSGTIAFVYLWRDGESAAPIVPPSAEEPAQVGEDTTPTTDSG